VEVVPDHDRVVLIRGTGDDLELAGPPERLRALLRLLDGTRTVEELAPMALRLLPGLEREELLQALRDLADAGVLEDAASDGRLLTAAELQRYDRQLRYFGDLAPVQVPRASAQARLRDASVAVLGLGGLGGMAAIMLASCGVGRLVGVDDDVVEISNLARQVLYSEDDLGRPKVDAARDRLRAVNGRCAFTGLRRRLDSPEAVTAAIAEADFVVAAVDWPAGRIGAWVNDACWRAGVPYVSMSQQPPLVRVGPTYVPGATGCHACEEAAHRAAYPLYDAALGALSADSPAATYAPACGVIGALVANEAIAHLTGIVPMACRGRAAVIDLRTLSVRHQPVPRVPGCPTCGGPPAPSATDDEPALAATA
jgi:bacteriocin biosynthesis cyclodehydratase domain-containing protein